MCRNHTLFIQLYGHKQFGFHFVLLWIMTLWMLVCKYLFEFPLSILLGVYLKIKLLDHMTILCLMLWITTKLFPTVLSQFSFLAECTKIPIRRHCHQYFFHFFFAIATLRDVLWYLIMGKLLVLFVHVLKDQTQGSVRTKCTLPANYSISPSPCSFDLCFSSDGWHLASFKNV